MAQRVSCEGETVHLKRHVAARLVRRGWAEWVVEGESIRRFSTRRIPTTPLSVEEEMAERAALYIPAGPTPPVEIYGLKWEPPKARVTA
jgi:hypothetical protein